MSLIRKHTRPDKNKDRIAWNESWERDLLRAYSANQHSGLASLSPPSLMRGLVNDSVQLALDNEVRQICDLQQDLARFAVMKFAQADFEGAWKALDGARRREFVLEGIYGAAVVNDDIENYRQWAPELNVERLGSGNGEGYMELLKQLLPDDADKPITDPIIVSNPFVDQIFSAEKEQLEGVPGMKTLRRMLVLQRALILSLAVWKTLLAFYGVNEGHYMAKLPRSSASDSVQSRKDKAKTLGKEKFRELRQQQRVDRKAASNFCWHCRKDESHLDPGQKLQVCSRCKKIGRTVYYCSRDCQAKDYKSGIPRPHKSICGKPLDDIDFSDPAPTEVRQEGNGQNDSFPEPLPLFKRSPALLHQISLLRKTPAADYFLIPPYPADDVGMMVPEPFQRSYFLLNRRKAMQTGDSSYVLRMYKTLREMAIQCGMSPAQLKKQLDNEYGVTLPDDSSTVEIPPTSEADMKEMEAILERLLLSNN